MGTRAGLWIDRSLKLLPFYAAYVVVKVYLEPCDDEPRKLVFPPRVRAFDLGFDQDRCRGAK